MVLPIKTTGDGCRYNKGFPSFTESVYFPISSVTQGFIRDSAAAILSNKFNYNLLTLQETIQLQSFQQEHSSWKQLTMNNKTISIQFRIPCFDSPLYSADAVGPVNLFSPQYLKCPRLKEQGNKSATYQLSSTYNCTKHVLVQFKGSIVLTLLPTAFVLCAFG